jgi:hypothetical protein
VREDDHRQDTPGFVTEGSCSCQHPSIPLRLAHEGESHLDPRAADAKFAAPPTLRVAQANLRGERRKGEPLLLKDFQHVSLGDASSGGSAFLAHFRESGILQERNWAKKCPDFPENLDFLISENRNFQENLGEKMRRIFLKIWIFLFQKIGIPKKIWAKNAPCFPENLGF